MIDLLTRAKEVTKITSAVKLLSDEIELTPKIQEALDFSIRLHANQFRKSGDPYVVHPIAVASITASFSNDETMVIAALLHDVIEDTDCDEQTILKIFGSDVHHIVRGLTKIDSIRDENLESSDAKESINGPALSFRKMLIASIDDLRILVVKLCDRMHNMLTLDALRADKQLRISKETLLVYAPIAHRLGISMIKNTLEDLSFKYIYPDEYAEISRYISTNEQNLQLRLNKFIESVKVTLNKAGYHWEEFSVIGRVKHYYSIYLKMQRKGIGMDEVLDLLAIRVIVKDPLECYEVLGALHLEYTPLTSRFKDYIALPKENGYKTIHTTLFGEDGIVEAQIRTQHMHQLAEYGVAAHWKYKGGIDQVNTEWLKGLSYQNESVEEFYELAKSDLFSEEITVFTPDGDYMTLPKDSVALDFAYNIHSEIGESATGAMVNNKKASLLAILRNGDIINIVTGGKPRLHCSWENAVKSSKAKSGIRVMCRKRVREIEYQAGCNILATILNKTVDFIQNSAKVNDFNDTIFGVTYDKNKLVEKIHRISKTEKILEVRFWEVLKKGYKKPMLKKIDHLSFYTNLPLERVEFDHCCHPKMGDDVIAFYDKKRAIVHHKLCMNAYGKIMNGAPMLFVAWNSGEMNTYRLIASITNQSGELVKLLKRLSELKINVTRIEFNGENVESTDYCYLELEAKIKNKNKIEDELSDHFKILEITALSDAYNK